MNLEEYAIMYHVEDTHWWYLGMAQITQRVLARWYRPGDALRILDAGCGTGAVMTSYLAEYGQVVGFDFAQAALGFCQQRGAHRLARASIMEIPFAAQSFDLAVSFDVLCERSVCDDGTALRELWRVLAPGGRLVLRLPAFGWMRGHHDEAVHIRHRYTRAEIAAQLQQAGFTVAHLSYANAFLFPLAWAKRLSERVRPPRGGSDLTLGVGPFNALFKTLLASESALVAGRGLPFGLTVVAVGQK